MSEITHTQCDGCPVVLNVDPDTAIAEHAWMEDDYGSHFCVACQESARDLEANEATGEELEVFGEEVSKIATQAFKAAKLKKKKVGN